MGCRTFRTMSGPLEEYVAGCVRQSLGDRSVDPKDVGYLVLTTTDVALGSLPPDFARHVLDAAGLINCVPVVLSLQQCCSSVSALAYAWDRFRDPRVNHVVLASFEFTLVDTHRIRSFAFFGDAVTSCLLSRDPGPGLRLVSSTVEVDYSGLTGDDSFASRQRVARAALAKVVRESGTPLEAVAKVFPTNLYQPLTVFNATVLGIDRSKLHFIDALANYAHCGNCDWMVNLVDYRDAAGARFGETYLSWRRLLASSPADYLRSTE